MSLDYVLYRLFLKIGTRKGQRIKQHLPNVTGELIAIPHPEMQEFMTAKPQPLQMKWRQKVIDLCNSLRHSVVVGVLRLECKFLISANKSRAYSSAVSPNSPV